MKLHFKRNPELAIFVSRTLMFDCNIKNQIAIHGTSKDSLILINNPRQQVEAEKCAQSFLTFDCTEGLAQAALHYSKYYDCSLTDDR